MGKVREMSEMNRHCAIENSIGMKLNLIPAGRSTRAGELEKLQ
jgi:hypothetical protein